MIIRRVDRVTLLLACGFSTLINRVMLMDVDLGMNKNKYIYIYFHIYISIYFDMFPIYFYQPRFIYRFSSRPSKWERPKHSKIVLRPCKYNCNCSWSAMTPFPVIMLICPLNFLSSFEHLNNFSIKPDK